jgi:hypothetical protein
VVNEVLTFIGGSAKPALLRLVKTSSLERPALKQPFRTAGPIPIERMTRTGVFAGRIDTATGVANSSP